MDFKKLLLLTCVFATAQVVAQDSSDDELVKGGTRKFDCVRINQLNVCGTETVGTLIVTGNETVNTLVVTGNETIDGNLTVDGNETIGGNLIVTGTIFVGGSEVIDVNLTVDGTATIETLLVLGNATVDGNLDVIGSFTANSVTANAFYDPAYTVGTPGVPGIGGALGWAYFYTYTQQTIASPNTPIIFNAETVTPVGVTQSSPTVFTFNKAGVWAIDYTLNENIEDLPSATNFSAHLLGTGSIAGTVPGSAFAQTTVYTVGAIAFANVINGHNIITVAAGDTISLIADSANGSGTAPTYPESIVEASIRFIRIA